jgi:hypothetical protein
MEGQRRAEGLSICLEEHSDQNDRYGLRFRQCIDFEDCGGEQATRRRRIRFPLLLSNSRSGEGATESLWFHSVVVLHSSGRKVVGYLSGL